MNGWQEWRKQQRATLIARRERIDEEDNRRWSTAITGFLKQGFPILQRSVIGFCWPHRGEYDPRYVMDFFRQQGATLALPEVLNKCEPLHFRKWWQRAPMKTGMYGIPIPDSTEPVTVDVLVVPMIGFDNRGFRLGYGSGYFDRTLAAMAPRPLAIGVAFEILRLEDLHPQPHDIPMNFVVTEAGIYRVRPTGLEPLSAETCAAETSIGQ